MAEGFVQSLDSRFASHWTPWQPSKRAIITLIPQSRRGSIREKTSTSHWYLANKRQNLDLNPCVEAFYYKTSAQSFCKWDFLTVSTRRPSQVCRQPFSFSSSFQAKYGSETLEEPIATEIPTRTTQKKIWLECGGGAWGLWRALLSSSASPVNPWFNLHRKKIRLREAQQHIPGYTASRRRNLNANPGLPDSSLLSPPSSINGCVWQ